MQDKKRKNLACWVEERVAGGWLPSVLCHPDPSRGLNTTFIYGHAYGCRPLATHPCLLSSVDFPLGLLICSGRSPAVSQSSSAVGERHVTPAPAARASVGRHVETRRPPSAPKGRPREATATATVTARPSRLAARYVFFFEIPSRHHRAQEEEYRIPHSIPTAFRRPRPPPGAEGRSMCARNVS